MQYWLTKENMHQGYLVLVNPDYLLRNSDISLMEVHSDFKDIQLENRACKCLQDILKRIEAFGKIVPVSGYRSLEEQIQIYNDSLLENGEEFTKKFVALPNASEHQTGLAIDLGLNEGEIDFICPSFPYSGICNVFRKEAYRSGFIERYQEEKKDITKISKEEWHFRYVGYPHSKILLEHDFCLEEYILYLKQFVYPSNPLCFEDYRIFYIPYTSDSFSIELGDGDEISGNNVDGFILTVREKV